MPSTITSSRILENTMIIQLNGLNYLKKHRE